MAKLIFLVLLFLLMKENQSVDLEMIVSIKLNRTLSFIDDKFEEFGFDGTFGVTLAQVQLNQILSHIHNSAVLPEGVDPLIEILAKKCEVIIKKMKSILPNEPSYMITFRQKLLNATGWTEVSKDDFQMNEICHLGIYNNWTANTIMERRQAIYKGLKTDECLREILEKSPSKGPCFVSDICAEMMLDWNRIDTGYLLTHRNTTNVPDSNVLDSDSEEDDRKTSEFNENEQIGFTHFLNIVECGQRLLYLQIKKMHGCTIPGDGSTTDKYIQKFCSYIFKETQTSQCLGFPYHDMFLEQVLLCGMEGYEEFLNDSWLLEILDWQNSHGCFASLGKNRQNISKRTSTTIDYGCSDHSTGLGAAVLALFLRYLMITRSI